MTPPANAGIAVVTGASSGLGMEMARGLGRRGYDLALVARRRERLEELASALESEHGVTVHVVPADLAAPEGPGAVADALAERGLEAEILVNNAGTGQWGPYLTLDPEREQLLMMINVVAPTRMTRLLLPGMVERGRGRILNVSSTAAFFPGPLMVVYYASKAYVLNYSVGLAEELRGTGVTVTCLCSGPIETEFSDLVYKGRSKLFDNSVIMEVSDVARQGLDAMFAGRRTRTPGLLNKILTRAQNLSPMGFTARVVKIIQGPKDGA